MTLRHVDPAGEAEQLGRVGYFVRDGFFGPELARALRAQAGATPLRRAGIQRGAQLDAAVRSDEIAFLTADEAEGPLAIAVERFEALRVAMNEAAWLGLRSFDLQLARYAPGARYVRHLDAFKGQANRRLTAIAYLNEGWEPAHGGALRLFAEAGEVVIEPVLDRLVVFLSERLEHEVEEAHHERWALTAWYSPR